MSLTPAKPLEELVRVKHHLDLTGTLLQILLYVWK